MSSFFRQAFDALKEANLVLVVIDSRFPQMMRVSDMENWLKRKKIPFILVLNKMDLLMGKKPDVKDWLSEEIPIVLVSALPKRNIIRLRSLIFSMLKDGGNVAVVGYPNAGKSSLINALAGRHAAPTSKQAGFTRGRSRIRLREGIYLFDTPGVIPLNENDSFQLMLMNARSPNQLRDIESLAMQLLEWLPSQEIWSDWLQRTYGFSPKGGKDGDEQLAELAIHWRKIRKGGIPDLHTAAIKLVLDWQGGSKKSRIV
ncbi:MAG: GTPase [Candidatus Diapherotrites archaeon]